MEQKVKGISLITLVITIIIIIILAGAIILSLTNSDVIGKASLAKESNDFTSIRQMIEMERSKDMFDDYNFDASKITIPANYSDEIEIIDKDTVIIKHVPNPDIKNVDVAVEKLGAVYIPDGFVASGVTGENNKEEGLVIYAGTDSVTTANHSTALTTRNQFVWVSVENYSQFAREHFGTVDQKWWTGTFVPANGEKENNMLEVEPITNYSGSDATQLEVNAMYESVKKYKGFYIARYEAANSGGTAISRKNQTAWVNIAWGTAGADANGLAGIPNTAGAVGKARAMYNTASVKSTLMYGVQWDAVMRWYKESGVDVQDSSSWGNHNSWIEIQTGNNETYKKKNIYDIAGNVWEWTMEAYSTSIRVGCGGSFEHGGTYLSASYRSNFSPVYANYDLGFRPALYVK